MKILNLMILACLVKENKYGLQIIKDIKLATNANIDLKLPSLYNSIKKMEGYGYLETYWENSEIGGKRRYCALLEKGKSHLMAQMANLDSNDKKILTTLIDGNLNDVQQNIVEEKKDKDTTIAIQPNFLNQYFDDTLKENNLISEQQNNYNNENTSLYDNVDNKNFHQEKLELKDIFGDMVYDNAKINNEIIDETVVGDNKINSNIETPSNEIITERQPIEENYRINLTLKSENLVETNHNKPLDNTVERIETHYTTANETKEPFPIIEIKPQKQETKQPNSFSALTECLEYYNTIGITYSLYDVNQFSKQINLQGEKKYYKRKFKFWQACLTGFITGLLVLCLYIFLDIQDLVNATQKYVYLAIFVSLLSYISYNFIKLLKYPKLLISYKQTNKKVYLTNLYISIISGLIIISICFFSGMTFNNIQFYSTYLLLPFIYLQVCYTNTIVEYAMAKNNNFFQYK